MRFLRLGVGALVLSGVLAGCDSGGGESAVKPEEQNDPDTGLKALKQMGNMPTPKTVGTPAPKTSK